MVLAIRLNPASSTQEAGSDLDTNTNNLNLQGRFGRPIIKTGKPTQFPRCDLKTRREILPVDSKVRTLRPSEMNALIDAAGSVKPSNAVRLMTLLLTGMRYMEAVRLHDHSDWFDGNFVWLPGEAQLKAMSNQKERYIRLSRLGKEMLPLFFDVKNLPSFETWREDLESWSARAGLDPVGHIRKSKPSGRWVLSSSRRSFIKRSG